MKVATTIAVFLLVDATLIQASKLRRNVRENQISQPSDICDMEEYENMAFKCFCLKGKYPKVQSTECWVFDPVGKDHFFWDLIVKSQPQLVKLKVIVYRGTLRTVPSNFLQNMPYLKNFTISFGTLLDVERHMFSNSSSLEVLNLKKNKIESLNYNSVSNLAALKTLNLEENELMRIKYGWFYNLPSLSTVKLNKNNITKIDDRAFTNMGNVIEMDLSENYICDINELSFFGLSKVKRLDLSFNKILSLTSRIFSELWDIEELYLHNNLVSFIGNRAFDGLRFLKTIDLSNNRLSRFPAGILTSVFTLRNLNLSNNRLETLMFTSIENFYKNLLIYPASLRLTGNRLSCDCRLEWVYVLHRKTTQVTVKDALEEIQCSLNPEKIPELPESLVCPYVERSDTFWEELTEQYKKYDYKEDDGINKTFLMTIPSKKLPCPEEYRPTPITVKEGPTSSSKLSAGQGKAMAGLQLAIVFSVFLMF